MLKLNKASSWLVDFVRGSALCYFSGIVDQFRLVLRESPANGAKVFFLFCVAVFFIVLGSIGAALIPIGLALWANEIDVLGKILFGFGLAYAAAALFFIIIAGVSIYFSVKKVATRIDLKLKN